MYKLQILRRAMKDMAQLPDNYPRLVAEQINQLADNPRPPGTKKLTGDEGYRLRVGVYRILYEIDDENQVITVYRVKHRREAYRR
jgi:mRNA interferase RelE/StbE